MELITSYVKRLAADLSEDSSLSYWKNQLRNKYGLEAKIGEDIHDAGWILREICLILRPIPEALIRACELNTIELRSDMGENREFSPNHGWYVNHSVTLNADIFYHPDQPDDFVDFRGYFLTRPQQTIYHEFSHALDEVLGHISEKGAWMKLSGWSIEPKPGFKRLIIDEPGTPKVVGEMYYDPQIAEFTRFYGSRNPWDDFADATAFYIGNLKDKVPATKRAYLDNLLKKYY